LEGGPTSFPQDFSCPAVLRIPAQLILISYTGLSPSTAGLSSAILLSESIFIPVLQPHCNRSHNGLGCSAFARHYLRNNLFSSGYLDVSVPRVPRCMAMNSPYAALAFPRAGFPIRKSTDQNFSATPRRLSQRYTSFIGS
jgi:hypothetical protein